MTAVTLVTKDATLDDLSVADYRDMYDELRTNRSLGDVVAHAYSFELECTHRLLWMLPAHPVGLPCMMPHTIEDSEELKHSASQAPCAAELKAWVKMRKEAVDR